MLNTTIGRAGAVPFIHRSRPAGKNDALRVEGADAFRRSVGIGPNLTVHAGTAQATRDQLRHLAAEIEDQHAVVPEGGGRLGRPCRLAPHTRMGKRRCTAMASCGAGWSSQPKPRACSQAMLSGPAAHKIRLARSEGVMADLPGVNYSAGTWLTLFPPILFTCPAPHSTGTAGDKLDRVPGEGDLLHAFSGDPDGLACCFRPRDVGQPARRVLPQHPESHRPAAHGA